MTRSSDYIGMERAGLLFEVQKFFALPELVCPHVLKRDGDKAWRYLHTDLLRVLLWLRVELLQVPLVCNTKTLKQRGFRCNCCELVKSKTEEGTLYVSPHMLGMGVDLSSPSMTAEEMREKIKENAIFAPCNVRIEADVNWLHIDVLPQEKRVYEFKV